MDREEAVARIEDAVNQYRESGGECIIAFEMDGLFGCSSNSEIDGVLHFMERTLIMSEEIGVQVVSDKVVLSMN